MMRLANILIPIVLLSESAFAAGQTALPHPSSVWSGPRRSQPVPIAPGDSALCNPIHTKIAPDPSRAPGKSYWVFVVNVLAEQNLNAIAAHANNQPANPPFQGCALGYEPGATTPAIERDIDCAITGNVSVMSQHAVFGNGSITCPVNLRLVLAQPNVNVHLDATYVYTEFAMLGVGWLNNQPISQLDTANPFLYYEHRRQDQHIFVPVVLRDSSLIAIRSSPPTRPWRVASVSASPLDVGLFLPVTAGLGITKEVTLRSLLNGALTACAPVFGGVQVGVEESWTGLIDSAAQFAERNHNQPGHELVNCNAQTSISFATDGALIHIGGQPGGPTFIGTIDEIVIDPTGGTRGDGTG